jgi:hypothetical protein
MYIHEIPNRQECCRFHWWLVVFVLCSVYCLPSFVFYLLLVQNKMVVHHTVRHQACQHDEDGIYSGEWTGDPVLWPCFYVLGFFTCHTPSTPVLSQTWIEQFGRYDLFSKQKRWLEEEYYITDFLQDLDFLSTSDY